MIQLSESARAAWPEIQQFVRETAKAHRDPEDDGLRRPAGYQPSPLSVGGHMEEPWALYDALRYITFILGQP